ncbi:thiolase family protein [Halobacillus litoralis]|uniref:Acetyl-CoA C-acyltransferase n=1 Tax=Halobacillus litoralis TaxID=45668 RepID=A0A410MFT1_9BACI|nr:thiolase family protein [Halobacillus litoralis]QAS53563.1 acetyl-CoA C-acyltransferase [Halobacillus litoralis]
MGEVVLVAGKRTAIGKMGGALSHVPPEKLASTVIRKLMAETELPPEEVDDVILGNVVGPGGNIARLSALEAGLPVTVPGVTVDRQCGSGLEAIIMAARLVQSGAGDIYLAGGVESTSLAPWKMEKPASIHDPRGPSLYGRARFSPEAIGDPEMGEAAENVAEMYQVPREAQDAYAYASHQKAVEAKRKGWFQEETVEADGVHEDECPRPNTSMEKLTSLSPVFREGGTVTAGNACPMNDGASVVLVMSYDKCLSLGLTPIVRFVDSTVAGVDPNLLGIGPVPAVRKLLERQNRTIEDVDVVEFNEAFASQVIASLKELRVDFQKVNLAGGALALGHPYGASGAILVTRLLTEMKRGELNCGMATLGIGGGIGLAALFERMGR